MNRILIALAAVMLLSSLQSCDFLRRLAGRPTSAELAMLRAEKQREEAEYKAHIDSLEAVKKALADSIAAADSIRQIGGTVLNPSALGGLFTTKLDSRYYIVVGAFTRRANAESLLKRVQDKGYPATLISFRNGFNAVGLCQTDRLPEAFASLKKVKEEDFCPDDVWIMVNE